ncbi:MAG: DUF4832 domain-containing protein [Actinomycetota bacterium]
MRAHRHRSRLAIALALATIAGSFAVLASDPAEAQVRTRTVRYSDTSDDIPNPERGFHQSVSIADSTGASTTSAAEMAALYEEGFRLARLYVRLDPYRDSAIPTTLLDELDRVLANARSAGMKLVLRFSYNFAVDGADAGVERIEQHLGQLAPVFERHADVVAVLQAGFVGARGAWESSTNGLTTPADRARVRTALLAALPEERMAQFRFPRDLVEFSPTALTFDAAFSGSDQARSGHHNDCVLADPTDDGTYLPDDRRTELLAYTETVTRFTPVGGETCELTLDEQRTDCPSAINDFARFHWDYLNVDFYGPTIDRWRRTCFDEIEGRLGYRFRLIETTAETEVRAGERLSVQVQIANDGFGKLYNPRPINVMLVDDDTEATYRLPYTIDARRVLPLGGELRVLDLDVVVPVEVPLDRYSVHLELPDGSASLAGDNRYDIEFANRGTWDEIHGSNDLRIDVDVTEVSDSPATPDAAPNPPPTSPPSPIPSPVANPSGAGYWMVDERGRLYSFGTSTVFSPPVQRGGASVVDLDVTPSGEGLWVLDSRGEVHARGDADFFGDVDPTVSGDPTTLAPTPSGAGYWIFTSTGGVSAHGDAIDHGDVTNLPLNGPIIASAATVSGGGYWLLGSDGGVFALGDAEFYGSMGGTPLNQPVNGITPDPDGIGYWLVAGDGGVFAFDAEFRGSMGGTPLNSPVSGLIPYGNGYSMVGGDGGAFVFSDRPFLGSLGGEELSRPIVAMTAKPEG